MLLDSDARRVYAVDVGHGQLVGSPGQDPRCLNLEATNLADPVESTPRIPRLVRRTRWCILGVLHSHNHSTGPDGPGLFVANDIDVGHRPIRMGGPSCSPFLSWAES